MNKKDLTRKYLTGWQLLTLVSLLALLLIIHLYTKPTMSHFRHMQTPNQAQGLLRYEIREDSSTTNVNAVQVKGTYDSNALEFIGVDSIGSSFSIAAEGKGDTGRFSIGRGTTGSVSGDHLVATLLFRARGNSTAAPVNVTSADTILVATDTTANIVGKPGVKVYVKEVK